MNGGHAPQDPPPPIVTPLVVAAAVVVFTFKYIIYRSQIHLKASYRSRGVRDCLCEIRIIPKTQPNVLNVPLNDLRII